MNDLKKGDKVKRIGADFGNIKAGYIYTFDEYGPSGMKLRGMYGVYSIKKFKRVEGEIPKEKSKKEQEGTSWEFEASSHLLIDDDEIEKTLTRERPMAIVHANDGTCQVYLHESIRTKAAYVQKSIEVELTDAMAPFWLGDWPLKDSRILSRAVNAVRAVRSARLKKKYRNPIECKVEMIKL